LISVVANLLTPYISAFVLRHFHARKSALREKQIKRRQVIMLQENLARRTSAKIDAIIMLMLSLVLLLLGLFLLQLTTPTGDSLRIATVLGVFLAAIMAILILVSGLNNISVAHMADRRERALDDFLSGSGSDPTDNARQFLDGWDLREFGVALQR
jgi:ABC-type multidrug transport system fused ATPase/permease subunit